MSLDHLLNQTVTIEPESSRDVHDKVTFGTAVADVKCRIEGSTRTLRLPGDAIQIIKKEIFVLGDTVVDDKSRITLPDGTQPPIVAVEDMPDRDGVTFYRLILTGVKKSA